MLLQPPVPRLGSQQTEYKPVVQYYIFLKPGPNWSTGLSEIHKQTDSDRSAWDQSGALYRMDAIFYSAQASRDR